MEKGYLLLQLHAHLPFVRHPEHEDFLEEDWLYEAITETYIPLIDMFDRLTEENIDFRLTMSLTPPLLAMLSDTLLQDRYIKHMNQLIELAEKEIVRTRWDAHFNHLAKMYLDTFLHVRYVYCEKYNRDLIAAFKKFQDMGKLDIITCGATHGFFPNMDTVKHSVRAQVKIAVADYTRYFGRPPRGIWLPECGFNPGDDEILAQNGIKYFFVDSHGVLHSTPRPKYGVFAPLYCQSGTACFGRDLESSKQVWSAEEGYPGDYYYRDFYRDIGFDLDFEYIKPYIHSEGIRINTGIKYFRITGPTEEKQPYEPEVARCRAADHAGNFIFNRQKQVDYLYDKLGRKPVIVAPYDAELYGHWWYEGPLFIEYLIRKMHYDQDTVRLITAHEYLKENPTNQVATPSFSSWGYKGYSEVWLEGSNDWMYRHLHEASIRMQQLADRFRGSNGLYQRALNQAARELLLAESSDWAFIMKTGTVVEYATKRVKDHINRFTRLYDDLLNDRIDEKWLSDIESKDNIFPTIDYAVYSSS
jgi:1,4-alpha-glucan branching enzyme